MSHKHPRQSSLLPNPNNSNTNLPIESRTMIDQIRQEWRQHDYVRLAELQQSLLTPGMGTRALARALGKAGFYLSSLLASGLWSHLEPGDEEK